VEAARVGDLDGGAMGYDLPCDTEVVGAVGHRVPSGFVDEHLTNARLASLTGCHSSEIIEL
jgi:hypothetical protein